MNSTQAAELAAMLHDGQYDRMGKPYIEHVRNVADRLANDIGADDEVVAAGYLHDVLEDTDATVDDLRAEGVTERTIAAVKAVTRRPEESYTEFIGRVAQSGPDAIQVKLADLASNLSPERAAGSTPSLRRRYEEAQIFLNFMAKGRV